MRRLAIAGLGLITCLNLMACAKGLPKSVDQSALEQNIAQAIGDTNTCVALADRATGKVEWTTGLTEACSARYPSCTTNKSIDVRDLAKTAASGAIVTTGCGTVSWAAGPAGHSSFVYGAVMAGDRALPGREIALRMGAIFSGAGL